MRKKVNWKTCVLLFAVGVLILGGLGVKTELCGASAKRTIRSIAVMQGSKNVTKKTLSLKPGQSKKISVKANITLTKENIKYKSSNKKVATVNQNGKITAKKLGSTQIKVTVSKSGYTTRKTWVKVSVKNTAEQVSDRNEEGKILVAYFSCTGTTENLAGYAAKYLNADLYEIQPKEPYTDEDLDYYTNGRADKEQSDPDARPQINGMVDNMSMYQTVVLAYPIWHGQAPRIISTFLESYDFQNKTIVPFCTSHSSGIGSSATDLEKLCADSAEWKEGKRFDSQTTENEIKNWLDSIDIKPYDPKQKETDEVGVFDFESKTVLLNSGYSMPINGLGTYSLLDDTCVESVKTALKDGVRLIDTAYMYKNEAEVGQAIRESMEELGIEREDIFVITKLYPGEQYENPEKAIEDALEKLDIGYIDMMLLHHPGDNDVKAYKAMEQAVADGKIHSIGLSNWYIEELEDFLPQVSITPALVQNEIHPYYQEREVVEYIQSLGIVVQAWYPLGGRGYTADLLGNEVISEIAQAHEKSSAQIILRWDLQNGVVVIPGSSNPDHIMENTQLYDFELTDEEMEQIEALEKNEKHDWY